MYTPYKFWFQLDYKSKEINKKIEKYLNNSNGEDTFPIVGDEIVATLNDQYVCARVLSVLCGNKIEVKYKNIDLIKIIFEKNVWLINEKDLLNEISDSILCGSLCGIEPESIQNMPVSRNFSFWRGLFTSDDYYYFRLNCRDHRIIKMVSKYSKTLKTVEVFTSNLKCCQPKQIRKILWQKSFTGTSTVNYSQMF